MLGTIISLLNYISIYPLVEISLIPKFKFWEIFSSTTFLYLRVGVSITVGVIDFMTFISNEYSFSKFPSDNLIVIVCLPISYSEIGLHSNVGNEYVQKLGTLPDTSILTTSPCSSYVLGRVYEIVWSTFTMSFFKPVLNFGGVF